MLWKPTLACQGSGIFSPPTALGAHAAHVSSERIFRNAGHLRDRLGAAWGAALPCVDRHVATGARNPRLRLYTTSVVSDVFLDAAVTRRFLWLVPFTDILSFVIWSA